MRPNGLPALRDLPITFKRRAATPGFEKIVGQETDRTKHAPHEYASKDGRWVIRATHHSGYGSTNSGRVRWHVSFDGRFFPVGYQNSTAISLESAIDAVHRRIAQKLCDGFAVLAALRKTTEAAERAADKLAVDLTRARDLLGRILSQVLARDGASDAAERLVQALARHVDLDALTRAVENASQEENAT